jgi:hypothetical protein
MCTARMCPNRARQNVEHDVDLTRSQMQKISTGKFHLNPPSPFKSFDHLVGAGDERRRYVDAERLRRFHIDRQLELGRL